MLKLTFVRHIEVFKILAISKEKYTVEQLNREIVEDHPIYIPNSKAEWIIKEIEQCKDTALTGFYKYNVRIRPQQSITANNRFTYNR